jgi:probable HAF family extracellular repeat protein
MGINDRGQIVGFEFSVTAGTQGFLRGTAGSFSAIEAPGATETSADGINDAGLIVGAYTTGGGFTTGGVQHGFLDAGGIFTTIVVPGASATQAFGINSAGEIVGWFDDATGRHGFLDVGGVFTTIDAPAAGGITEAYGINDGGQVSGRFNIDNSLNFNGFLATPVVAVAEPSSLALLAGLIVLGTLRHKRRA